MTVGKKVCLVVVSGSHKGTCLNS